MKLYYSKTSPYARKVLLLAKHLGLDNDVEVVSTVPLEADDAFLTVNPLSKVPALAQPGETPLFDSRVIAEFLLDRAGMNDTGRNKTEILKRQALADGMMDAAVAAVMESKRIDAEQSAYWMERWHSALDRSIACLEEGTVNALENWGLDSIAIACALDYICFRLPEVTWQTKYPNTAAWYERVIAREDMQSTNPRG